MNTSEIRRCAHNSLKGKYGKYIGIFLITSIILVFIPFMQIPLGYALICIAIRLRKNEDVGYFDGVSTAFTEFVNSYRVFFSRLAKTWPYLLGSIGSYIFMIIGSVIFYITIMANGTANETASFVGMLPLIIIVLLGVTASLVCSILYFLKNLYYSLSNYILYDNTNKKGKEIVEESKRLMTGHRWDIVKLQIPYWLITIGAEFVISLIFTLLSRFVPFLAIFARIISSLPTIFIAPLIQFALIEFFDELSGNNENYSNDEYYSEPHVSETTSSEERKGFSITSLVLGIATIITCCFWPLALLCAILAIVFGILGIRRGGKRLGIAGIVSGIIGIILAPVITIVTTIVMGVGLSSIFNDDIINKSQEAMKYYNTYEEKELESMEQTANAFDKFLYNSTSNSTTNKNTSSSNTNNSSSSNNSLTVKTTTVKYTVPSGYKLSSSNSYSSSAENSYKSNDSSIYVYCRLNSYNSKTAKEYLESQLKYSSDKNSGIQTISVNGKTIYYTVIESSYSKKIETAYVLDNNYLYTVSASCYDNDTTLTISTIRDFLKLN